MADQQPKITIANLFINEKRFVYANGVKICRLTEGGQIEFQNKGHGDSRNRGATIVVSPADLVALATLATKKTEKEGTSE